MPIQTEPGPLVPDRPDDVRRVRDVLDRVGYDFPQMLERIGSRQSSDPSLGPRDRPRLLRCTRDGDPLATLIRTFLIGVPVPLESFRRAVAPTTPEEWAGLGLVEIEGDAVGRLVVIKPVDTFLLIHDTPAADGHGHRDHVMGVSGSSLTCASTAVRPPARWTLDLGTGSGFLAMLAAAHSQHVLAADVNPRAVAMARFNAMFNRIDNIEAARGDLFEPAGDIRFDLIGSNPPFVVSPRNDMIYRDSGLPADAICERIVREAPGHLAEGGIAQVMCNWVRIAGRDWLERLARWFDGSECDVWIIHGKSLEPGDYAQLWLNQGDPSPPDRYADDFDRWMRYYQDQGIEAIDAGLINLRRRTGQENWVRVDTDRNLNDCGGAGILMGFAGRDLVDHLGDDRELLAAKLVCRPELRVSQRLKPADSGWMVDGVQCVLDGGPRFEGEVNPLIFHVLTLCRGNLPLSAVLSQAAARAGQDLEGVREDALDAIRGLVMQGFLWPADLPLGPPGVDPPGATAREEPTGG